MRAYEEVIDFIAAGSSPGDVAAYQASPEARARVAFLVAREKADILAPDEASELDHYVKIQHMMRLAKARARRNLRDE